MMRLHLATPAFEPLADGSPQIILAANGVFVARENAAFRAIVPLERESLALLAGDRRWDVSTAGLAASLRPLEPRVELKRLLPAALLDRMVTFFRAVWRRDQTEGLLQIVVNPVTGTFGLHCPLQTTSRAGVSVDAGASLPDGLCAFGDVHSHPCGAFHSDTDQHDESFSDGLHLVVGHLDRSEPEVVATLVVWGHRRSLTLGEVFEPDVELQTWLGQLEPRRHALVATGGSRARR